MSLFLATTLDKIQPNLKAVEIFDRLQLLQSHLVNQKCHVNTAMTSEGVFLDATENREFSPFLIFKYYSASGKIQINLTNIRRSLFNEDFFLCFDKVAMIGFLNQAQIAHGVYELVNEETNLFFNLGQNFNSFNTFLKDRAGMVEGEWRNNSQAIISEIRYRLTMSYGKSFEDFANREIRSDIKINEFFAMMEKDFPGVLAELKQQFKLGSERYWAEMQNNFNHSLQRLIDLPNQYPATFKMYGNEYVRKSIEGLAMDIVTSDGNLTLQNDSDISPLKYLKEVLVKITNDQKQRSKQNNESES